MQAVFGLGCALGLAGCMPEPAPGEYGVFRYVGNVRGSPPLSLFPPLSDRDGNAYVLYGDPGLLETRLFVGGASGGWTGSCDETYGNDYGAHGLVGRGQRRAWYWSGEALVAASGRTGYCWRVLPYDPSSGARLNFRAVVPWVWQTPHRTTMLAWIQSPTDRVPFQVVVDLDLEVYTHLVEFEPKGASDIEILGVGGNPDEREGVVLVRYRDGNATKVRAYFMNEEAETVDRASVSGLEGLVLNPNEDPVVHREYGVVGYLQPGPAGLYAGLTSDGRLVVLDRSGGGVRNIEGWTPAGVHRWQDELFLVGSRNGKPRIARIDDDGEIGSVKSWDASEEAADNLDKKITVLDDRSLPSHEVKWRSPRTAMGAFPFLHAHRLDHYADGTTTWLVAGPDYDVGGEPWTAIAYVPVGISYLE